MSNKNKAPSLLMLARNEDVFTLDSEAVATCTVNLCTTGQ